MNARTACFSLVTGWWLLCCTHGFGEEVLKGRPTSDPISQASLHPWKGDFRTPAEVDLPADEVYFRNATGQRLRGWIFTAEESTQTILFCMGNTGNISLMLPYAKIFQDAGFEVLLFDYQGYGNSEGVASISSLLGDATAAFDFLVDSRQRKPADIGVFGVSLGSLLALTVAVEKEAGAVAVEDVFIPQEQIDNLASRYIQKNDTIAQFAMTTFKALFLSRVDPLQNVKKLKAPLFLLHGVNDWLLPPSGTMKVAKARTGLKRVWLMQETGHAPESLEVNDDEYAAQLQSFFTEAFQQRLSEPKLSVNSTQKEPRKWVVRLGVDAGTSNREELPVQIVLANERGQTFFRNELVKGKKQLTVTTRFQPTHASAIYFRNTQDIGATWEPKLSKFSKALQGYRRIAHQVFRSERTCEYLCIKGGEFFYTNRGMLGRYSSSLVNKSLQHLPSADGMPERIKARYAGLLARIDRWSHWDKKQAESQASGIPFAEKMLEYLPEDPDGYYEIGNARFHLKFRDSVVAHSLYELAKARLVAGRPSEAQELLRQHVATLPDWFGTNLTEERISSIESLDDLRKKSTSD